jgi:hypothetical protein
VQLGCVHAAEQRIELLRAEVSGRASRRVKTALRHSNLPTGQTLPNFDFAFQLAIERSRIETLATCAGVRGAETVLIQGLPRVGKTHLAMRLGMKSVEQGRTRGSRDREEGRGVEPLPSHLGTLLSHKTSVSQDRTNTALVLLRL